LVHIGDKRALEDLREAGQNDENCKVRGYAKKVYERISGERFWDKGRVNTGLVFFTFKYGNYQQASMTIHLMNVRSLGFMKTQVDV